MSVKNNIIANYIGQISIAILSFIFVPIYVKYLGVEAYGLVGMFSVLQIALNIFDAGIVPLLSREMSCFEGKERTIQYTRDLLRTMEILCLFLGIIFSSVLYSFSDFLSINWFNAENLKPSLISEAIKIAVIVISLRAMEDIYKGTLIGLQQQVSLNVICVTGAILRSVGVIYVLKYIDASLKMFYFWQLLSSVFTILGLLIYSYKKLDGMLKNARFSFEILKSNFMFSTSSIIHSLILFFHNQSDKLIVSKFFNLTEVAYYTLASSVANVLLMVATPLTQAFYPKILTLLTEQKNSEASIKFHCCCQLLVLLCGVSTLTLIFYGHVLLGFWLQDFQLALNVMPYLRILAISSFITSINSIIVYLPYMSGQPIINAKIASFSLLFILISTIPLTYKFGSIGTSYGNLIQNLVIFIFFPLSFNCCMKKEQKRWFTNDFLIPIITMSLIYYIVSNLAIIPTYNLQGVINTIFISLFVFIITLISCDLLRNLIIHKIKNKKFQQ